MVEQVLAGEKYPSRLKLPKLSLTNFVIMFSIFSDIVVTLFTYLLVDIIIQF